MSSETQSGQAVVKAKRHYDQLALREFKSTIPPHLLANLPDDERFMVETMSKLENQFGWLSEGLVKTNGAAIDLDERVSLLENNQRDATVRLAVMEKQEDRVNKLWDWKQLFTGKWGVIAAIAIVVLPLLLKFLLDMVIKWIKP